MAIQPYFSDETLTLYGGDCLDVLPLLPDASVDAVVTDPPYELAFMGRAWDASGIAYNATMWRECLRVLKSGGHLLAFGGTRTWHRMAVAIEDAGFEVRDSIHWIYGSGFPKSLDVSKAIDRRRNDREAINEVTGWLARQRDRAGLTNRDIDEAFGFHGMAGHWTAAPHLKIAQVPRWDQWERLRELIGFGNEMDAEVWRLNGRKGTPGEAWAQREVIAERTMTQGGGTSLQIRMGDRREVAANVTAPATDDARRWQGWGTALKPSHEPIVVARKPLAAGTVAGNVLEHGTGGINIDGCRVEISADDLDRLRIKDGNVTGLDDGRGVYGQGARKPHGNPSGRWPSNIVLTHSAACNDGPCAPDCPVAELDQQAGTRTSGSRKAGTYGLMGYMGADAAPMPAIEGDSGGASRFFPIFRYEAKAASAERPRGDDGTAHPTVKPLALMRWLVRLVTPPGGTVLDPFLGSGTTAEACLIEGFRCIGIERDEAHLPLIKARLAKPIQPTLGFGELSA